MNNRICTALLTLLMACSISACGGGSGGGSQAETGQVAVVFTDGPTDQYQRILISMSAMSLIGPGGHVDLYNGPEVTFDLLEMSDWADLAFNTKVLAGTYNKIRIELTKVELVDMVNNESEMLDKLPANGKIDLNPRGSFEVSPDFTTVIKLDMDAKKSFQVVATGNGKLQLRPIFFVDIYEGDIFLPDRLVRIFGTVDAGSIEGAGTADTSDDAFRLCDIQFISQQSGPSMASPDDCVKVYADGGPGVFDSAGIESDFSEVAENEPLTAVGFVVDSDDPLAFLGLNAVILEDGAREPGVSGGWDTTAGNVVSDQVACDADQCFDFEPAETGVAVQTRMQPGTRVFRADGIELTQADVNSGDGGSVDAVATATELLAALVVLSTDVDSGIVTGTLASIGQTGSYAVLMAGLALIALSIIYYCTDVRGWKGWTQPALVYGMNAITVFVLAGIVARLLNVIKVPAATGNTITVKAWIYNNLLASWLSDLNASLAYAISFIIVMYLCMLILYKKRVFIRI